MGSFVDLELAFTFHAETPPIVLAAFAAFRTREDAPVLPTLEEILGAEECRRLDVELDDYFTPEERDAFPVTHRAVAWRSLVAWGPNAYIPGPTYTTMHWDARDEVWSLATRTLPKSDTEEVAAIVAPLGLYASDGSERSSEEVGRITTEDGLETIIWSAGGAPFRMT